LEINENVYGLDHPNVAAIASNLGRVLQDLGIFEAAKKNFEELLDRYKSIRTTSSTLAKDINNLGQILLDLGDFKAKKNFESALKIGEQVYGLDHPQTAVYLNSLGLSRISWGFLLMRKKNFREASTYF